MPQLDILGEIFEFLDYSHIPVIAIVCREWNRLCDSNRLWRFYFYLLSNNLKELEMKRNLFNFEENDEPLFWKIKTKEYSQYKFHLPKRKFATFKPIEMEWYDHYSNAFTKQVIRMVISRIHLEEIFRVNPLGTGDILMAPFSTSSFCDRVSLRIKFSMEGLDERFVLRVYNFQLTSPKLSKYSYSHRYFLYLSTESDDVMNSDELTPNNINLSKLESIGKSFIFYYEFKKKFGRVTGEDYLIQKILSKIIPTNQQYNLSPASFIPIWNFILGNLMKRLDSNQTTEHKELLMGFPNCLHNPLVREYRKSFYRDRAMRIIKRRFPTEKSQLEFLEQCDNLNEIPSSEEELKQFPTVQLKRRAFLAKINLTTDSQAKRRKMPAQYLKQLQWMVKSSDYLDYYLKHKYRKFVK